MPVAQLLVVRHYCPLCILPTLRLANTTYQRRGRHTASVWSVQRVSIRINCAECRPGETPYFYHPIRGGENCLTVTGGYRSRWSLNPQLISGSPPGWWRISITGGRLCAPFRAVINVGGLPRASLRSALGCVLEPRWGSKHTLIGANRIIARPAAAPWVRVTYSHPVQAGAGGGLPVFPGPTGNSPGDKSRGLRSGVLPR